MHSLISAPTLGFDLTRMDGGAATAELLTAMLAVPSASWAALSERLPRESVTRVAARARAFGLAGNRPSIRDLAGVDDPASTVRLLQRAPIGTLSALLECVRTDVLVPDRDSPVAGDAPAEAPEPVVTMAVDAVCATYLRELLSGRDRRALAAGWLVARRLLTPIPADLDLGPQEPTVRRLLTAIETVGPVAVRALADACDRVRASQGDWAAAMHSMTWAVHVSGRIRAAAAAQFRLVQAIDVAGIPVSDRAAGVWNLLSGAVQALIVRDLADGDIVHELLAPAVSALGPVWLFET